MTRQPARLAILRRPESSQVATAKTDQLVGLQSIQLQPLLGFSSSWVSFVRSQRSGYTTPFNGLRLSIVRFTLATATSGHPNIYALHSFGIHRDLHHSAGQDARQALGKLCLRPSYRWIELELERILFHAWLLVRGLDDDRLWYAPSHPSFVPAAHLDEDATTHISEETKQAAIRGPVAIIQAVVISGVSSPSCDAFTCTKHCIPRSLVGC